MKRFLAIWRARPVLGTAFVLAAAAALTFAVRAILFAVLWSHPPEIREIEPWMTPRLVAHARHLRREDVQAVLGLTEGSGRQTLEEIAEERGIPVEELIAALEALPPEPLPDGAPPPAEPPADAPQP